ncbi:histidine kinase dimerization/phosphoacceptor domain -containing protein [Fodinibius sp.]|uniref:histidine kinase dimerization/phosphoacceptor domain -containing protein n=1 Tax=Fodinibius sp. TaxID=1872440 RepID=UPI002ACD4826|nr:histidine kinase dimerization/phosphoacceptor domain -containing protein [Fodinibius sp.]MDZ7658885.1 histidine kinase dimerization/phosphoacceptor domain -containing protein [Fodinibius sp.]
MSSLNRDKIAGKISYNEKTSSSLQILLKNISSVNKAVKLRNILRESVEVVQNVMNTEASSLMLLDEDTGELIVSMPTGPVRKEVKGKRIEKDKGIGSWVVKNGKPFYSNNVTESELFAGDISEDFTSENIICVPLRNSHNKVIGVLQAINRRDGDFTDRNIPVFEALADHVALAIERSRELQDVQSKLEERDLLLTEVHHRLKNNLSTITALIELELADIEDEAAKEALQKTMTRIKSMTEVHDFLYNNKPGSEIKLKLYVERLSGKISEILSHASRDVKIQVKADDVSLDTDRAMSCGLLLNELLVNCYKHAFDEDIEDPRIIIEVNELDDKIIEFKVSDNGAGIEEDFSITESGSVGGWLIDVLIRRLDADINIQRGDGTTFLIRFDK